jgi:glycosyltransferase involved in cell wall biosynthesis
MKRVWIICQHAGSPRHGMNYRPYNVARQLAARGIDVTIFSGSTSHEFYAPPVTTGRYTFEDVDGLRYCWIRTPEYSESKSAGRVLAWLAYLRGLAGITRLGLDAPDAIVVSSPPPYPIVAGASLARRYGARLVFEVRDLWPLSLVELGRISRAHPLIVITQWIEDFAYYRADLVISVLPEAEGYMRGRGLAEGKFAYVPNGVDVSATPQLSVCDEQNTVRRAMPGRPFIVGYVGKAGLANALSAFVGAANELRTRRDIGFAIVGDGSDITALKRQAADLDLDNLVFIPSVPKAEVPGILASLDACYLGLKAEPVFRFGISPTKLFDYLLAARPVIMAVDAGNDPVRDAGCGFTVKPEDSKAIAEAVARLADMDRDEREGMGRAGRAYVEANHDWSILGGRYAEILFS